VGATNLAEPDGSHQNVGWAVGEAPPSAYMNFQQQQYDKWIRYLDTNNSFSYGPGLDGTVVFDGVATGASMGAGGLATGPSGNCYRLVRPPFGVHIGIASGIELQVGGHPIFATADIVATGSGKATANSIDTASSSQPGMPPPAGTIGGGCTGGYSGSANGTFGGAPGLGNTGSIGGAGGAGGLGVSGHSGGAGGTAIAPSVNAGSPYAYGPATFGHVVGFGQLLVLQGGGGGGQGGLTGFAAGAGGGGGGVVAIAARSISLGTNLSVQAKGGPGGQVNGPSSTAGGGGGGGGGGILLAYQRLSIATGGSLIPAINCAGGAGGAGGVAGGQTGASGLPGQIFLIPMG
jgi:hypothetical protein